MALRTKIATAIPWIEPILDYFDWRKRAVALVAAAGVGVWSFMKDLPWPVIFVLGFGMLVLTAYGLAFPAFIKLVNVGVKPRPNYSIWKHKKEFSLIQAAYLLADREPAGTTLLNGDAAAWYEVLREAIQNKEIIHIPSEYDQRHTDLRGKFDPQTYTLIPAAPLKKFCEDRDRFPEFLR